MSWNPRAIIFDMDGLLVDSEPVWMQAETQLLTARGKVLDMALREKLVGLRTDEFIGQFRQIYALPEDVPTLNAECNRYMLDMIPTQVKAKPGAAELLAYITEQRIPSAIASSSPLAIIEAVVKSQGWGNVLRTRVSADSVPLGKPAPDVYLKAAELLGIDPRDCLALEDSPNGARAAVAAGMVCYAVPDAAHTRASAFDDITNYVFDSLYDVLSQLCEC
jgi:HAD superfamily hydrolase (TIGR01509 family)